MVGNGCGVKTDASEQSAEACGQAGAGLALACEGGASDLSIILSGAVLLYIKSF